MRSERGCVMMHAIAGDFSVRILTMWRFKYKDGTGAVVLDDRRLFLSTQ